MLIDARIVMGDNDVFMVNYRELFDVVDCFLVVECVRPFASGKVRTQTFRHSGLPKVRYILGDGGWAETAQQREERMRAEMMTAVIRSSGFMDDDLISVLDGDEVLRREGIECAIQRLRAGASVVSMNLQTSNFFANWVVPDHLHQWPKLATVGRVLKDNFHYVRWMPFDAPIISVKNAGWHFSYCGKEPIFIQKCMESGDCTLERAEANYSRMVNSRTTMFSGKRAEVMGVSFLPEAMRTPEMLEIFYRP